MYQLMKTLSNQDAFMPGCTRPCRHCKTISGPPAGPVTTPWLRLVGPTWLSKASAGLLRATRKGKQSEPTIRRTQPNSQSRTVHDCAVTRARAQKGQMFRNHRDGTVTSKVNRLSGPPSNLLDSLDKASSKASNFMAAPNCTCT